jgi:SAM-dependent methyltransferase
MKNISVPTIDLEMLRKQRNQRQQWDLIANRMPDILPAPSTSYYRHCEIALIRRFWGSLRGKRVLKLDLWNEAVNTRILNWMQSEGAKTFGVDISFVTTRRARENAFTNGGPLHLCQADIRNLPFESNSFDFVYTMGTIEHIDEYQDALREVHRTLKPGGKAIIGVPHKWNIFLRPLIVRTLDMFGKYPYSPEKSFSSMELRRAVETAGLTVQSRTGILTAPGIIRMADIFCYSRRIPTSMLWRLLLTPFDFLERKVRWAGVFGYLIALVAEKNRALESWR